MPRGSARAPASSGDGLPDQSTPEVARLAVVMARSLRGAGVRAPLDSALAFAAALAAVGLERRGPVYWAGRATLVRRPEDVPVYDRVFAATFGEWLGAAESEPASAREPATLLVDAPPAGDDEAEVAEMIGSAVRVRWSDREVLAGKDFAECSPAELDEAHRLMADIRLAGARRRSRRLRPTRRSRGTIDQRATSRRALRTGGEPLRTVHRAPGERFRRLVLLCDVSGSMERYSRELVRFAHAAVVGRTKVEVFTLGTRCTRITRQLGSRDPDAALTAAAAAVVDWSGGTRLGEGLRTFNDTWGLRGMARGATVVILSDGWDRGDPVELGEQVRRLHQVTHRLVWVNPLKAAPGFEPVAGGMAAALPHVDVLVEGHSLRALESLAALIGR